MTAVTACLRGCTLSRTLYLLLPAASSAAPCYPLPAACCCCTCCLLLLLRLLLLLPTHHSCTWILHAGGVTNCTLLS